MKTFLQILALSYSMLLLDCEDFSQNQVSWDPGKKDYDVINLLGLSIKVLSWSNFKFSFGLLSALTKSESTSYLLTGAHGLMMHLSQLYRDSFVYVIGRQRDDNLQHYSLGQLLQQPQDLSWICRYAYVWCSYGSSFITTRHITEVYNTFKLCLSAKKAR